MVSPFRRSTLDPLFRLLLLETDLGRLDVLREVPPAGDYDALSTTEFDVGPQRCKVPSIDELMTVKRSLRRPQDVEVALQLEAIRAAERS